ncbi:hypothetical protein [Nonomuraea sp. NPDC050691]|uniref:hypothetical protein n=1 Tax=Nonomuraea sp. NPDC050691 TaxID=3155661 RepID=UPI0033FC862C
MPAPWTTRMANALRRAPGDAREIERWNPRLRCAEEAPFTPHHRRMPVRRHRALHRLMHAVPALRNLHREFRFTF